MSGLIWIKSVWHSVGIPQNFFRKCWFWKKISRRQKHEKCPWLAKRITDSNQQMPYVYANVYLFVNISLHPAVWSTHLLPRNAVHLNFQGIQKTPSRGLDNVFFSVFVINLFHRGPYGNLWPPVIFQGGGSPPTHTHIPLDPSKAVTYVLYQISSRIARS